MVDQLHENKFSVRPSGEVQRATELVQSGKQTPHDAQQLIDAYSQYRTYKQTFQQLETGEAISETLQPPWDRIQKEIDQDKRNIQLVLEVAGTSDHEELGRKLYDAKRRKDSSSPQGKVRAYQKGASLVLVVENEEDLKKAFNLESKPGETTTGAFQANGVYTFGKEWNDTYPQVPTIIVVDHGDRTEQLIEHEKNHQHARLFFTDKLVSLQFSRIDAWNAIGAFNDEQSPSNEKALVDALKGYTQTLQLEAVEEAVVEMVATQRMDWREAYADTYFKNLTKTLPEGNPATSYINQAKAEFIKDIDGLKNKIAGAVNAFETIEKDKEIVYGTIGMRLLNSDVPAVEQAVNSMGFLKPLASGEESYYLRQELDDLQSDARAQRDVETYNEVENLKTQLARESQEAQTTQAYGYTQARKEGEDFPTAMSESSFRRKKFLDHAQVIANRKTELIDEMSKRLQLQAARQTIAKEDKPTEKPATEKSSPSTALVGRVRGLLNRFRK